MSCFKVNWVVERVLTFFVDAEDEQQVHDFLKNNPEWNPGDTPGLIDVVGDENEVGYELSEDDEVVANFAIDAAGRLQEKP